MSIETASGTFSSGAVFFFEARPKLVEEAREEIVGMRAWPIAAFAVLVATPAVAQSTADRTTSFRDRLNTCVATWKDIPSPDRGRMTYRQYTTKCLSGKAAAPIKSSALCQDGTSAPGTAPEGACANSGGVAAWIN